MFIYLLLFARELDENGLIRKPICDISWRLRVKPSAIKSTLRKLKELGVIEYNDEQIQFLNWKKRQYKSDNVTERVKRFREKNETLQPTLENRTEQIQNRIESPEDEPLPVDNFKDETKQICKRLVMGKFPLVYKFVGTMEKRRMNPGAVLHVLQQIEKYDSDDPWAYGASIVAKENGNFNERDYVATQKANFDFTDLVSQLKERQGVK